MVLVGYFMLVVRLLSIIGALNEQVGRSVLVAAVGSQGFPTARHRILRIKCSPESVDTTSDNSFTFSAKAASSKAFCILWHPGVRLLPKMDQMCVDMRKCF